MIIHGNLFPDTISKEAHCVLMERCDILYRHGSLCFVVAPFLVLNLRIGGSVINLPIFESSILVINSKLFCKKAVHQTDGHLCALCYLCRRTEKGLLQFICIFLCPLVVVANDADGGINTITCMYDFIGQHSSVTVTDDICSPFFCHF